jgi:hypothetical protein
LRLIRWDLGHLEPELGSSLGPHAPQPVSSGHDGFTIIGDVEGSLLKRVEVINPGNVEGSRNEMVTERHDGLPQGLEAQGLRLRPRMP